MKLKAHFILIFLVVFLSNKLVGQVVNGELKPCPGVAYTYIFSGPTFTNYFQWNVTDGTIISQNSSTVVVIWNNEINDGGRWNLRVHYEAMGSGGKSGGSTYLDLKVKPKVTSPYNISGSTEIPGDFVGTKTYTAGPVHSTYPATSFVWTTNTGIQMTTTSPSVTLDMSDKQLQWIGVQGKVAECSSLGKMSKLNVYFTSAINGPSTICNDGIYTITNPGTITLVNATGIATLTALGNNQWKVSKIGNGRVILRSTLNGKTYNKEIVVGSPTYKDITNGFEGNLGPGGLYDFELKEGFDITSYEWSAIGGTILSGKNSSTVRVRIDMNPYNALNDFSIILNYSGGCGTGTVSASRYVNSSGSGGGGDTPIDYGETGE